MKPLPALLTTLILALALPVTAYAEATPQGGPLDIRIRTAVYIENQVYRIETDLRHSTTIHFWAGERFEAVIVGDTESFQVDPIPELGNVLTIKPHVANASTNMTVITNRRTYSFHLREGSIPNRTGMFFEVRFRYPDEERRATVPPSPRALKRRATTTTASRVKGTSAPAISMTTGVIPISSSPKTPASLPSSRPTIRVASAP